MNRSELRSQLKADLEAARLAVARTNPYWGAAWQSWTAWDRLGYEVADAGHTEEDSYRYGNRRRDVCRYTIYHAAHVRLKPRIWMGIVRKLPPQWQCLRRVHSDRATIASVHDFLLEQGDAASARRLKPALATAADYDRDMLEHRRREEHYAEAQRALREAEARYDAYWGPILQRRQETKHRLEAERRRDQHIAGVRSRIALEPYYFCTVPEGFDWQTPATLVQYLHERGKSELIDLLGLGTLATQPCRTTGRQKLVLIAGTAPVTAGASTEVGE